MLSFILRRLAIAIPTLLVFSFLMFLVLFEAGDPTAALRGSARLDADELQRLIEEQGYNDPVLQQYLKWLGGFVTLDWKTSTQTFEPAFNEIMEKLPATLELLGLALIVTVLLAVPIGIVSAVKPYSVFDNAGTGVSYLGFAMPTFFVGLMFQIIAVQLKLNGWGILFAILGGLVMLAGATKLRSRAGLAALLVGAAVLVAGIVFRSWNSGEFLVFTGQRFSARKDEVIFSIDHLQHLALPVMTLTVISIATWSRFLRASMFDVLNQDYLRTARAKGLTERAVIYKHGLRNGLLPLITIMAIDAAAFFAGAVVTESVFAWPGIGTRFLEAVNATDIPVSMGVVMLGAIMVILFNLLADIAYAVADPRIRLS